MSPLAIRIIQAIIDFLLILASFTIAYFLRVGFILSTDFPFSSYAEVFVPTALIWSGVLAFERLYSETPLRKRQQFTRIIISNLVGVTIFVLFFFYKRDVFFSRLILVYVWAISSTLLIVNAWAFRLLKYHLYKRGIGTKKTLIVGANKSAEEAIKNLLEFEPYYQAVAILDAYGTKKKEIYGVPVLGKMNSIEEIIKTKGIEVIIQADCIEQSLNLVQIAKAQKLDYFLVPSLLGAYDESISSDTIGRKAMITLRS